MADEAADVEHGVVPRRLHGRDGGGHRVSPSWKPRSSGRTWTCDCGATHDRDVNAAKNILAVGLTASVCGAGVRPQRSTPGGQSVTKQKPLRREP
nr:zinc ribbon domain-containing protein [Streptomyces sp. AgN23]